MKKKLVLKIGTSTLTMETNRICYSKVEDIARQIKELKNEYDIILVSSAAIATARQFIEIDGYNKQVVPKQAMAAIGQPKLMKIYDEIFTSFDLKVAQCLMTYRDFENKTAVQNTKNTIDKLLEFNYIPIINENDTVGIEEIMLGDNDKLSALIASVTNANILVLVSDINGLYNKNPHKNSDAKLIEKVEKIEDIKNFIDECNSVFGTGGMTSKIQAAEVCKNNNIEMWILNGLKNNFIKNAINGKITFTKFL